MTASSWYELSLGDGITAAATLDRIAAAYSQSAAQSATLNSAVFKRFDSTHSLHCEITAFFSPAATTLALQFDAQRCGRPARVGLELVAGSAQCWSALFPG